MLDRAVFSEDAIKSDRRGPEMDKLIREKQTKKDRLENFIASSRLDGYEVDRKLTERQLETIEKHSGTEEELKEKLIKSFGG